MNAVFRSLVVLVGAVCCVIASSQPARSADGSLQKFLHQYCQACHGPENQEAELRVDSLVAARPEHDSVEAWARVLEMIEAGEMPPADEPRPDEAAVEQVIKQISERIAAATTQRPPALRRMNRQEYENTMHDLLGIDVPLADLLPEDGSVQGFDNVGTGLSISSVLMEQYLEAANVAFDAVIRRIEPLPAETRRADLMQIKENIESVKGNKGGVIEVANSFVKFTPGWPPARVDAAHPIEDGVYRCRLAVWPQDPGGRTIAVAVYVGALFGPETLQNIGVFDVTGTPEEPRLIEFTTRFKEGHAIHILPRIWPEHVTWRDKHEKRPGVGIMWCETYGPLDQSFPSEAQKQLFGDVDHITMVPDKPIYMRHRKGVKLHRVESQTPRQDAERIIRTLIPRAFRRPVSDKEMQPFVQLTLDRLDAGRPFEQAVRAGFAAVLCSPQFLLLNRQAEVDDYEIASRLSYFLWSTLPDEPLMQLAAEGKLSDPAVRHAQVERMVKDPRIDRFVENFTGQWLDLRDIDFTTPAQSLYPEYEPLLKEAMLGETRSFFTHLLQQDLSVRNLIDSDFTFLNERLADHYGIPGVQGHEHFRKVMLPEESVRGGVLTQASVLKVTANGTATSPVIRGVWVMDSILGRPLPPPPPGVPAVEPDIRGATTIRQQLDQHRDIAACARCHNRIDPPGFALEHFDAIGGERQWYRSLGEGEKLEKKLPYRKGLPVETASQLADGREFSDFREFRQCLLEDQDTFARALASKLLIYASGRPVRSADRLSVQRIIDAASQNDLGLRSMIHAVVQSELFLSR
ncbi:DUF1592 domain-containing protein [Neorhodopirellula pilleata]|uniref:Planctomycete cytochrome C n=1 Tax=Neorhodopirellula pilleata TaxID=2714738 RepID=A0A5C6ABA9_9BACT|nr:DUF1592 domain-containing protein [Neorhodopirellula pilleata]TWT97294.1 Planctomycete cytochrome C [Neorhodopirellula pilleata]